MLNLKIIIPLAIIGAGGTAAGGYYAFTPQEKNNEKIEAPIIAKTLQKVVGQNNNNFICYEWRFHDTAGRVLTPDDCGELKEISLNSSEEINKSSYKLLVKKDELKKVLTWHNLLKEDNNLENNGNENWEVEEWKCNSKEQENPKDFQEIFVSCLNKNK